MTAGRLLLAAVAFVAACGEPGEQPVTEPVDPIARPGGVAWVVTQPPSDGWAALQAAVGVWAPQTLVLGGVLGAGLPDGSLPAGSQQALVVFGDAEDLRLGVEADALGPEPAGGACWDPADPGADAVTTSRASGLGNLLDAQPALDEVFLDYSASPPLWERACNCAACAGETPAELAARFGPVRELYSVVAENRGTALWHGDRVAGSSVDGVDGAAVLDAAFEGPWSGASFQQRARPAVGPDHPWATASPWLARADQHRVAVDVDLCGSAYGATDALLLFPFELHDQLREQRSEGLSAWLLGLDAPGRSALTGPHRANLDLWMRFYRDFRAEPQQALSDWLAERYQLDPASDDLADLIAALRHSGRALALPTHPLGLAVDGLAGDLPDALPLSYEAVDEADPRAARQAALAAPGLQDLVQVHQWVSEGNALALDAVEGLALAADAMEPTSVAELSGPVELLLDASRAWGLLVDADATLRALELGVEGDLEGWLRADAAALDALAADVEVDLASGTYSDAAPVVPDHLRAVAAQLRERVGEGAAVERDFPTISRVRWKRVLSETHVQWRLDPAGAGWVEEGPGGLVYDDSSPRGEGPASNWTANVGVLPAGTRYAFRPCGEANGYIVCASDTSFWASLLQ